MYVLSLQLFLHGGSLGKLVKPIQQIDTKLKELASQEGDLTARLQVNSNDEIGAIATSFNKMLENLQHIINRVQKHQWKYKPLLKIC